MGFWEWTKHMNILEKVFDATDKFTIDTYEAADVLCALSKETLSINDFAALLSPPAEKFLEQMAVRTKRETRKYFGNSVSLYTPLYISNHCENQCVYCGFNVANKIKRGILTADEIEKELQTIAQTGLREILLLTGEDRTHSNIAYIAQAVSLAAQYFSTVGVEIYPLDTDEYHLLNKNGADFVSVYQETYDRSIYNAVHKSGPKKNFEYRFDAQERAIKGGMRGVSFGVLFGLSDFRQDAFATGLHAMFLQQKYPHAEISLSVPRMRAFPSETLGLPLNLQCLVNERQLLQILLAYRIFMPFATITISTREQPTFRDNVMGLVATKMSAEVKTSVGGHFEMKGDEQFTIADTRTVKEIHEMLQNRGLQPVYTDYI